ncbi:5'-nucleotidase [Candidatus Sumerlaeota bacterium]|nr:5'-nucleotidase [Candidatus Sumerlaeota bacterium]
MSPQVSLENKLVVAITSRALFDLDEEHRVFESGGLDAYRKHQRERESEPLKPGTGFPLVKGLLQINEKARMHNPERNDDLVEVIMISRNDSESGYRIINSIEHHGIGISRYAFTDGREAYPYLKSFCVDLFLSAHEEDVRGALQQGIAAGRVYPPPGRFDDAPGEVRIAFDGDAVIFSDEAERVYQTEKLKGFYDYENSKQDVPLDPGPFKNFLQAVALIQRQFEPKQCPLRTYLVTARNAPAIKRAINTLRQWNVRVNESFFLGGLSKADFLRNIKPHIFFDDQETWLDPASGETPSALVLRQSDHPEKDHPAKPDEDAKEPETA